MPPELANFGKQSKVVEYHENRDLHAEVGGWGPIEPGEEHKHRYGIVSFNWRVEVLLREPANHFAGYAWQFAKGTAEKGEHPLDTARARDAGRNGTPPQCRGLRSRRLQQR